MKKNTARQSFFSSLLHVWKCRQTWSLYFQKIAVSFDFQLFISDVLPEMMIPATFWLQVAPISELTKKDEIVVSPEGRAKIIKQSLVRCLCSLEECYKATILVC